VVTNISNYVIIYDTSFILEEVGKVVAIIIRPLSGTNGARAKVENLPLLTASQWRNVEAELDKVDELQGVDWQSGSLFLIRLPGLRWAGVNGVGIRAVRAIEHGIRAVS